MTDAYQAARDAARELDANRRHVCFSPGCNECFSDAASLRRHAARAHKDKAAGRAAQLSSGWLKCLDPSLRPRGTGGKRPATADADTSASTPRKVHRLKTGSSPRKSVTDMAPWTIPSTVPKNVRPVLPAPKKRLKAASSGPLPGPDAAQV